MGHSNTFIPKDNTSLFTLRRENVSADGAFGKMYFRGESTHFAYTLERTYEQPGEPVLKIGPGLYRCTRTWFHRGGYRTYEVHVYGHSRILFHIANIELELEGCIALGKTLATFNGKPGIGRSRLGFNAFMTRAANVPEFFLEVA